jgi:hypothetical protein
MCHVLYITVCPFVLFLLAIALSVLLRFRGSDYPFGMSLFLYLIGKIIVSVVSSIDHSIHDRVMLKHPLDHSIPYRVRVIDI